MKFLFIHQHHHKSPMCSWLVCPIFRDFFIEIYITYIPLTFYFSQQLRIAPLHRHCIGAPPICSILYRDSRASIYSWLSGLKKARGSCTGFVAICPTKV